MDRRHHKKTDVFRLKHSGENEHSSIRAREAIYYEDSSTLLDMCPESVAKYLLEHGQDIYVDSAARKKKRRKAIKQE